MDDVRLIDANAAKEKLGFAIEPFIGSAADEIRNDALLKAIDIVDSMPTVDAHPVKRGHWIEVIRHRDADGYIVTDYKCSECGIMLRDTNHDDIDSEFYCYHCGAKNGGDAK